MSPIVARIHHSVIAVDFRTGRHGHRVHRLLWKAFPGHPPGAPQPFTFRRLDRVALATPSGGRVLFLVQSKDAPQWPDSMPSAELMQQPAPIEYPLLTGDRFIYRVVASPLKTLASSRARKNNRKVRLLSAESIWQWFERRARLAGFRVDERTSSFSKTTVTDVKFDMRNDERCAIVNTRAQFDGLLEVSDPDALKKAIEEGFSNRKSFGYGMLNILPLSYNPS